MKTIILLLMLLTVNAADPILKDASKESRVAFAKDLANHFDAWQEKNPCGYKIDSKSASAQWMIESNWGRSGLCKDAKNLGGIKGKGPKGTYSAKTREVFNGKEVVIVDGFRAYNSFEEFYVDYRKIALRMKCVGKSGKDFYQSLKDANYATDPKYVELLTKVYNQIRQWKKPLTPSNSL